MEDLSNYDVTLWLWTEGAFARRIMYYLLIKGLVSSPAALLKSETTRANIHLNRIKLDIEQGGWVCTNRPSDPQPPGASNPCMRVKDNKTSKSTLIRESTSILLFLEKLYGPESGLPLLQTTSTLDQAVTCDLLTKVNLQALDTNYFLRNTIPVHAASMRLKPEEQSQITAMNAQYWEVENLARIQDCAVKNGLLRGGNAHGWLTPGTSGPGIVDVALATNQRFIELIYSIDMLGKDERLIPLQEWYRRFKKLSWWDEFEDREDLIPDVLKNGKTDRAAWVHEQGGLRNVG